MTKTDWTRARNVAKKAKWNPDRIQTNADVRATLAGCWFNEVAAKRVVNFFRQFLKHSKGQWAGQPFTLLPWQREGVIDPLFGWKRSNGTRRYRKGYIEVPKKNGKSALASGISLYLLIGDKEPGAEVYNVACDRDQAGIVFNEALNMVRSSPELDAILEAIESRKRLVCPSTASLYCALSADVAKQEGLNIHGLIIDELHAHKSRAMFDTLMYGGAARRQPLQLVITTAGVYDPTSIGWEQHEYARKVLTDQVDDWAFHALIYAADEKDDWTDPKVHERVNPSWGITINPETFTQECKEAQESPAKQNAFRRYRTNQWVQQSTRWIDLGVWDDNHKHPLDQDVFADGRSCYGGLDLASVNDLAAWVLVSTCEDDDEGVDVRCRFWVPEAQLSNRKNPNKELYQQWVDQELLLTTPGNVIDYDAIETQVLEDAEVFNLIDLNIDKLFQGQQVANHLTDHGLNVIPMPQTFLAFGPGMKEFERRLLSRKIHHGAHPILRWMADNVVVKMDSQKNLKIDRQQSKHKVDGMVALVMAIDRMIRHEGADQESAYDEEGLMAVDELYES